MTLCIDFDGTCVYHEYPGVGDDVPEAVAVLKELIYEGHDLILYTMRSGPELQDAINWFERHNIVLYGVQINPSQRSWTKSPKCYAQIYIDDSALGCPLTKAAFIDRMFVNWVEVRKQLKERGIL